jgi:anaphase-promoting complex subunit 8
LESGKDVLEYARSALYVARFHVLMGGNDLALARDYLSAIAASNAEEVGVASELLKKTQVMITAQAGAQASIRQPRDDAAMTFVP